MKITLYGLKESTCTQRILILLTELGLNYNFENVDLFAGEHKTEDYMKIQPFGKIPALKVNKKIIFESRAILKYIAKQNRGKGDFIINFNSDMWLEVESQNYSPCLEKIVFEKLFKQMLNLGEPNEEVVQESLDKLHLCLDVFNNHLENQDYLAGNEFTIADISCIPYTYKMLELGYKDMYKKYPNVYKWIKRIIHRESVKKVLDLK
jgi:glutathione S-transferase